MKVCHKCGKELPLEGRILRNEQCPWCLTDLHSCMNCIHWDPSSYNECLEVGTQTIRDRERANFCGSFEFIMGARGDGSEASLAKEKLNKLFDF